VGSLTAKAIDRRVLQSPLDHFALQPFGILANCGVGHELMLVRAISLDLLSNVFVEMREPFVRHMFDAHDQLLLFQLKAKMQPRPSASQNARHPRGGSDA
jgi:hypothetical protein